MTPEQITIKLAEWDGAVWHKDFHYNGEFWNVLTMSKTRPSNGLGPNRTELENHIMFAADIPPYTTSLDAVMPLVRKLEGIEKDTFFRKLYSVIFSEDDARDVDRLDEYELTFIIFCATPLQISEALLRTLNLWED